MTGAPRHALAFALLVLPVVGCDRQPFPPPVRPNVTGAAAVVERFECHRCHDAPGRLLPAVETKHCVNCHQSILAGEYDDRYPAADVAKWKANIHQLIHVPSLTALDARFRRDWLIAFLQSPHDLRPDLEATMPALRIGPSEAEAIADHFTPVGALPTDRPELEGDVERGRDVFERKMCAGCHRFAGVLPPNRPAPPGSEEYSVAAVKLAPDLRVTRDRMTRAAVDRWLKSPGRVKPDTLMPSPGLSRRDRADLVAFLFDVPAPPPPRPTVPTRPPVLDRHVAWPEVRDRVFKKVCWHCHSDPVPAGGDGGPGNTGGFGFDGKGLDFGQYETARKAPARLVDHLLARHAEVAGRPVPGVLGMPLGLTPIPIEDIQRIETWFENGTPEQ